MHAEFDGLYITDKNSLHDCLKERLMFPEYYGRNLDALYDMLTSAPENTVITLRNTYAFEENLGGYGLIFIKVLHQAAIANPDLTIIEE